MLVPIRINYKNLFAHADTTFVFRRDQMCLFIGINEDTPGADSNGAGKSSTVEAITLALTGEVYRGLTKEHFVRLGQESCDIRFDLYDTEGKTTLTIVRTIYAGNKSSKLELLLGGKEIENFGSKNKLKLSAQDFIYELLGFGKEDLFNFFVIGQENESSFFSSTDGKQKEVISRFSNYTKVDKIIEKIKEDTHKVEEEKNEIFYTIQQNKQQIEGLLELGEELNKADNSSELKEDLLNQIEAIEARIVGHKKRYKEIQEEIRKLNVEIGILTDRTPQLPGTKNNITDLKTVQGKARNLKVTKEKELRELKQLQGELLSRTGQIVACPKCKWQFIPNDDMTAEEVNASREQVETLIKEANTAITRYDKNIDLIGEQIQKLEVIRSKNALLIDCQTRLKTVSDSIENAEKSIADKNKEIVNIKKTPVNQELIDKNNVKIEALRVAIDLLEQKQTKVTTDLEDLNFHLFAFSKQFRTYISNKTIRTIQDIANYYLQLFQIDLRVFVSGFKVNKDGTIRDKIEIWVLKNGKDRLPFKALSGGEKARIKLCGVISLRKLIMNASPTGGFDLLCLDELLEGMDSTGQQAVVKILDNAKITSLLVMHHAEDIHCNNKIVTVKKNGVSSIVK